MEKMGTRIIGEMWDNWEKGSPFVDFPLLFHQRTPSCFNVRPNSV